MRLYNLATASDIDYTLDYIIGTHDNGDTTFANKKYPAILLKKVVNRTLTNDDSGSTLLVTDEVLFCTSEYASCTFTLPDVSAMQGKSMTFIHTANSYESYYELDGPFIDASSYALTMYKQAVTLTSDGTNWWVKSEYLP